MQGRKKQTIFMWGAACANLRCNGTRFPVTMVRYPFGRHTSRESQSFLCPALLPFQWSHRYEDRRRKHGNGVVQALSPEPKQQMGGGHLIVALTCSHSCSLRWRCCLKPKSSEPAEREGGGNQQYRRHVCREGKLGDLVIVLFGVDKGKAFGGESPRQFARICLHH